MITPYEFEDLLCKIKKKNQDNQLKGAGFTFDEGEVRIITAKEQNSIMVEGKAWILNRDYYIKPVRKMLLKHIYRLMLCKNMMMAY